MGNVFGFHRQCFYGTRLFLRIVMTPITNKGKERGQVFVPAPSLYNSASISMSSAGRYFLVAAASILALTVPPLA